MRRGRPHHHSRRSNPQPELSQAWCRPFANSRSPRRRSRRRTRRHVPARQHDQRGYFLFNNSGTGTVEGNTLINQDVGIVDSGSPGIVVQNIYYLLSLRLNSFPRTISGVPPGFSHCGVLCSALDAHREEALGLGVDGAWSRRGGCSDARQRWPCGAVPFGHWKTTTLIIAALRFDRIDGALDGDSFLAYLEQFLAPTLSAGKPW